MTPDESIKALEKLLPIYASAPNPISCNAIKLGIEALKFTKNLRDISYISKLHLLPSETKED